MDSRAVPSGFCRKLHQTVLPISLHLPASDPRFYSAMPGSSVTRTVLFRTVTRAHIGGFCAHGSLHLYVSLRRAPPSRHLVKAPFSGFRVVLVRLFATPETSVLLHSLVFHYFSLSFSISTEKLVSQESSLISPYG